MTIRRFEGNAADVNRSKERSQRKRETRHLIEDEEAETDEEAEFRKEQERLDAEEADVQSSAFDWLEDEYRRKNPGVYDDFDDTGDWDDAADAGIGRKI